MPRAGHACHCYANKPQYVQGVCFTYSASGAATLQVDTPIKKLLVAVGVGYLALVLLVPTLNVFYQVRTPLQHLSCPTLLGLTLQISRMYTIARQLQHDCAFEHDMG